MRSNIRAARGVRSLVLLALVLLSSTSWLIIWRSTAVVSNSATLQQYHNAGHHWRTNSPLDQLRIMPIFDTNMVQIYLTLRETAEIKADPDTLRALAEARESVRDGDVVYGTEAIRALVGDVTARE